MGRRRRGKDSKQAETKGEDGETKQGIDDVGKLNDDPPDVFPTLAVEPVEGSVAVAYGAWIKVFNTKTKAGLDLQEQSDRTRHTESIRCLQFSPCGKLLASAGDDKLVKLWNTSTWTCIRSWLAAKKVSALCFTKNGEWLLYANKFGEVLSLHCVLAETPSSALIPGADSHLVLGHCCSIVTDIQVDPACRLLATADRDEKVRVTRMPCAPAEGAHDIAAFCLGHSSFVSAITFITAPTDGASLLVSGGGDGTVRLWNPQDGRLLDTFDVLPEEEEDEADREEADEPAAVVAVACGPQDARLAVAIQGYPHILMLQVVDEGRRLEMVQMLRLVGENNTTACPTRLAFGKAGELFVVGHSEEEVGEGVGSSVSDGVVVPCVAVAVPSPDDGGHYSNQPQEEYLSKEAAQTLGSTLVRAEIVEQPVVKFPAKTTRLGSLVPIQGLQKRKICELERESRKANRNDKKP